MRKEMFVLLIGTDIHFFECQVKNILCTISLAISNVSHLFCAHLCAVPISFNCNEENRILGKRNHEISDAIL